MSQNISATNSPKPTSDYEPADPYPIPNTAFLSIEHPAILTSIQGGIKTLGGEKAIAKVHFPLPLRFVYIGRRGT